MSTWVCSSCYSINQSRSGSCYSCRTARPDQSFLAAPQPSGTWLQKSSDYQRPKEPEFVYTGLVLRGVAYVVDVLLIIGVSIFLWSAPFMEPVERSDLALLLIGGTFLYFLIGWGEFGTTVGMRIFRLSIVRTTDGLQIGYIRALVRIVVFIATSLVIPTFILIIPVLLGRHRRAIHDYAAGSAVIRPAHGRFAFVRGSATA